MFQWQMIFCIHLAHLELESVIVIIVILVILIIITFLLFLFLLFILLSLFCMHCDATVTCSTCCCMLSCTSAAFNRSGTLYSLLEASHCVRLCVHDVAMMQCNRGSMTSHCCLLYLYVFILLTAVTSSHMQ